MFGYYIEILLDGHTLIKYPLSPRVRPGVNSSEIRRNSGEFQRNSAKTSELQRISVDFGERTTVFFGRLREDLWNHDLSLPCQKKIIGPLEGTRRSRELFGRSQGRSPCAGQGARAAPGAPAIRRAVLSQAPVRRSERLSGGQKSKPTYPAAGPRLHRNSVENQPSPPDA